MGEWVRWVGKRYNQTQAPTLDGTASHGASSSTGAQASSSTGADASNFMKRRLTAKMSPSMQKAVEKVPTGIEVMIQVLADDEVWCRARIWTVLSDIIWKSHSSEYSNMRSAQEVLKYYKGYISGLYIRRLSEATSC